MAIVYKSLKEMRAVTAGRIGYFELEETKDKPYFKLYDLVTSPQTKLMQVKDKTYQYVTIHPGKKYKMLSKKLMAEISERFTEKRRYSDDLKKTLDDAKIEYKEVFCKTCGGRTRKLEYKTVEVVDGADKAKRKTNSAKKNSKAKD